MGILHDADGWGLIFLAAVTAVRPARDLVKARRSVAPARKVADSAWPGLVLSAAFLANGISILAPSDQTSSGWRWLSWLAACLAIAAAIGLAAPGIVARRKAGLPWWRVWADITPPLAAAGPSGPVPTLGSQPVIEADARTLALIDRIEHSRFSTTRLSPGYDEEEVDDFLDKVIAVLSQGGQPDQGELRAARFTTTRLRPGYVVQDVDCFLQEIARDTMV